MDELTRIFSCGKSMTTAQMLDNIPADVEIDVYFPEMKMDRGDPLPLTEYEILGLCPQLVGKTFVTVSEIPILFFMREIRKKRIRTDEIEVWSGDRRIEFSDDGGFIDPWDVGGFFELGFHLRFS